MTQLTTNETFQERMFNRVREQLGDLMTEAELKKIVDTALDKAFFEERVVKAATWNAQEVREPSYFVKQLQLEMKAPVELAIKHWLAEHPEEIEKVIKDVIGKGFLGIVHSYITEKTTTPIYNFANDLRNMGILK